MTEKRKKCTGKSSRTGEPCKNWPMQGTTVCHAHGGRAPQVKARAAQRVAEQQAAAQLARLDVAPVENPLAEIAKIAGQVVAWKDTLAERVNELTTLAVRTDNGEQLRAEVALERAFDRCEKFLSAMARMNIDDRLAAIQEQQARVFIAAFERVLDEVGLSEEQRQRVGPAMTAQLEVILGGKAA